MPLYVRPPYSFMAEVQPFMTSAVLLTFQYGDAFPEK